MKPLSRQNAAQNHELGAASLRRIIGRVETIVEPKYDIGFTYATPWNIRTRESLGTYSRSSEV